MWCRVCLEHTWPSCGCPIGEPQPESDWLAQYDAETRRRVRSVSVRNRLDPWSNNACATKDASYDAGKSEHEPARGYWPFRGEDYVRSRGWLTYAVGLGFRGGR